MVMMAGFCLLLGWGMFRKVIFRKGGELIEGLKSLLESDAKQAFIVYTIIIWLGYFYTSYGVFFAIPHDYDLGFFAGFSLVVLGSIVRSIPLQGGAMGVYHVAVVYILGIPFFNVDATTALTLGVLIHGIQVVIQLVLGGSLMIWYYFDSGIYRNWIVGTKKYFHSCRV